MKIFKNFVGVTMMAVGFTAVSCDDDNNGGGGGGNGNSSGESYVVAATTDEAAVLLQPESFRTGSISVEDDGLEAETATTWWFHSDGHYLYRLVYNQGNAGVTSSYALNENGEVYERNMKYEGPRFTTYGDYDNYIVTASSATTNITDANGNYAYGILFGLYNVESQSLQTITPSVENMLGNGEYVTISGILQSGSKIYTGIVPLGVSDYGAGETGLTATTETIQSPDSVWIAIYDGVEANGSNFNQPTKIVGDDRIAYASSRYRSQFYSNIAMGENGYLYVFSSSYNDETTLPSGVIRLNTSTDEFDEDFYINIQELSGTKIFKVWYAGNDRFLLQMYNDPTVTGTTAQYRLAILDASVALSSSAAQTFKWITGLPDVSKVGSYGFAPYLEDGLCYMPIVHASTDENETADQPAIYVIDPATATATKGLEVTATSVGGIGKLTYPE